MSNNPKTKNTTANLLHAHSIGASPDGLVFHHSPSTGGALHPGRLLTAALQTVDLPFVETKESHQKFGAVRWLGRETALFFQFEVETKLHVAGALLTPETLSRLFPARASVRSCSRPFSTLPRALENRRSARTHGACASTRNTHPAFPARGNTICIRSLRKCLSPSARGPDI